MASSDAATPKEYLSSLPADRQEVMRKLHKAITDHIPEGFEATMQYGMISFVVPHSRYPAGYHTDARQALPFISIASQKNYISVYHMGLYSMPDLLKWFLDAAARAGYPKIDMGKSCLRFKKISDIPHALLGELSGKITVDEWIDFYDNSRRK